MACVFYSSVILNSTETMVCAISAARLFYSSVILNSTETVSIDDNFYNKFYSSVILLSKLLGNYNSRRYY